MTEIRYDFRVDVTAGLPPGAAEATAPRPSANSSPAARPNFD